MIRPMIAAAIGAILLGSAGFADEDAIEKKLAVAKADYEKDIETARGRVTTELKKKAQTAQKDGNLTKLEKIEAEIKAFEDKSALPKSISTSYESDLRRAKAKLADAYGAAVKEYTKDGKVALAKAIQADLDELKAGKGGEFTALFNGKDLSGWKATQEEDLWAAEDGTLVCKGGSKGGLGWLLTEREYADFELRCEYRWVAKAGNSGIALRTPVKGNPALDGLEIQLIDDEGWPGPGKLLDEQRTGSIYGVHAANRATNKPIGEWNTVRIVCKFRSVTVEYNGKVILRSNLDLHRDKFTTHPGLKRVKGHVGLQSHTSRIEFRNVSIKEL